MPRESTVLPIKEIDAFIGESPSEHRVRSLDYRECYFSQSRCFGGSLERTLSFVQLCVSTHRNAE